MAGISRPQTSDRAVATCKVEPVLTVDRRGQIVIPKEVQKWPNIRDGNKTAVVSWMNRDELCCFVLIHPETLYSEVSGVMHSLLADKA